jgi:hypothetical protein
MSHELDIDPVLEGAAEMSREAYGTPKKARRIRDLVKAGIIPAGYFGGLMAIRRSRLRECIDQALGARRGSSVAASEQQSSTTSGEAA